MYILTPLDLGVAKTVILFAISDFRWKKTPLFPRENDNQGVESSILSTDFREKATFRTRGPTKTSQGQGQTRRSTGPGKELGLVYIYIRGSTLSVGHYRCWVREDPPAARIHAPHTWTLYDDDKVSPGRTTLPPEVETGACLVFYEHRHLAGEADQMRGTGAEADQGSEPEPCPHPAETEDEEDFHAARQAPAWASPEIAPQPPGARHMEIQVDAEPGPTPDPPPGDQQRYDAGGDVIMEDAA